MDFYLVMDCDDCGEEMHISAMTLIERNGRPVIPFDVAGQETFECYECGSSFTTGDFDYMKMED